MTQTITAIYEHGVLRPLTPLDLPERTQVELDLRQTTVSEHVTRPPMPEYFSPEEHRQRVRAALITAGLMQAEAETPPNAHLLTDTERDELARSIPPGRPLSEIIIEEREGR